MRTVLLLLAAFAISARSLVIQPGLGLERNGIKVVVFEHTEMGTGGLVLNCPTPIKLGDLPMPQFRKFNNCPLMLGSGVVPNEKHSTSDPSVALRDLSPWFWLHDVPDVAGSYTLAGAEGDLFMGGNIESISQSLLGSDGVQPNGHIKFFRRYRAWAPGQLEEEIGAGRWHCFPQNSKLALEPVHSMIRL